MYEYGNGLKVCCDWLEFTMNFDDPYVVLKQFGFTAELFRDMEKGSLGYSGMLRHKSAEITVLYNGNADMGVHVQVKGSAVTYFLEQFKQSLIAGKNPWNEESFEYEDFDDIDNLMKLVLKKIKSCGWLSRIDLAVDDIGAKYYTCEQVHKVLKSGDYVSRIKKWHSDIDYNRSGEIIGYTVYLGSSRNSRMFLRVYDKRLEQKKEDLPDWIRWELVLKDERSENFAEYIISGMDFAGATASVLNGLVRFVNNSCKSNKSLCDVTPKWRRFVGAVQRLKLTTSLPKKSVERSYDWINRQCAPTIAGLVAAFGGSMEFLEENLDMHFDRLSGRDKEMFLDYFSRQEGK